ncbi:MAG: anaerobic ribonucleoside-triphosphate reductase activating protein [Clostridia bacterium]
MLIAGFQKTSFVDYPGQPSAVVFTAYCNLNCTYCHNYHILGRDTPLLDEETVLNYLDVRQGLLKALVISGGEPTLQQNLDAFIRQVRTLSYAIKLDTNGCKPQVIKDLLREHLLDYVAMDIKAPLELYSKITRTEVDTNAIQKSIALLRNSDIPHEFRLTFAPELSTDDVVRAAKLVDGCDRFYLQQYRVRNSNDPAPHPPSTLKKTAELVQNAIGTCTLRGLGV